MGCWNTTCGISGLPIHSGEDVVVFLLTQNRYSFMQDFVWHTTYFEPCLLPFYGQYDDYGGVENCHGPGLPLLIKSLRKKLLEMEVGENECHDIAAKRSELDVKKLFELDREDRLFIGQESKKLKVVHVQIKKSIFDAVMEWDEGLKQLERIKVDVEKEKKSLKNIAKIAPDIYKSQLAYAHGRWFERLGNPLLSAQQVIEKNEELVVELCKGTVVNEFMNCIRKPWIKQIGNGSQNTDLDAYKLLIEAMNKVIKADDQADLEDVEA